MWNRASKSNRICFSLGIIALLALIAGTAFGLTTGTGQPVASVDTVGSAGTVTNATTVTSATTVNSADTVTSADDVSGTATTVTSATDISGTATTVANADDITGTATTVTSATDISGTATTVTNADDISGTATSVTSATDISGTASAVTTASDISGTASSVTTATDISGTATTVTTANDISGTATTVTSATDISGAATTVTNAADISGKAYNSTFSGSVGTVNEVTDELSDADNDTVIYLEKSADEDKVRIDVAGAEHLLLEETAASLTQNGTTTVIDTGATASESPLKIFMPNLSASPGTGALFYGVEEVAKNCAVLNFSYTGDGSASNYLRIRLAGLAGGFYVDGSGNVGVESVSDGDKFYVSGTSEITDTLTLSKASGTGLSVTSDIDFNAIAGGATKAEINTTCDGNTATAAEITARCDGVPNYSTDDNSSPVTVTSGGVQAATLDLGTVTAGDVFFIEAQFTYSKGVSGGKSNYYINQASGTATITFPTTAIATSHDDAANITYNRHFGGMCFVTGSGTLVMQMGAFSDGSDSSIGSGACDLAATFIKKQ
jgi:hypothetical protein